MQAVPQFRLSDAATLQKMLRDIVRNGGEGLMLHRDDAIYATGRSSALLKLTPWLDAEASVVAHLPGKGKYAGILGALRMELPDGRHFSLGSGLTDALRCNPPPVGTPWQPGVTVPTWVMEVGIATDPAAPPLQTSSINCAMNYGPKRFAYPIYRRCGHTLPIITTSQNPTSHSPPPSFITKNSQTPVLGA